MILTVGRLKSSGQTIALTSASSFLPAFLMRRLRTVLHQSKAISNFGVWRASFQRRIHSPHPFARWRRQHSKEIPPPNLGCRTNIFRVLPSADPAEILRRALSCSENGATPDPPESPEVHANAEFIRRSGGIFAFSALSVV